jgi:hypothetical protein
MLIHTISCIHSFRYFKVHGYFTSSAGKIFHDGMDDPQSWTYPSNQTKWLGCTAGDLFPEGGENYCGVTNESKVPYTDEDLALAEGLKRMDLGAHVGSLLSIFICDTKGPFLLVLHPMTTSHGHVHTHTHTHTHTPPQSHVHPQLSQAGNRGGCRSESTARTPNTVFRKGFMGLSSTPVTSCCPLSTLALLMVRLTCPATGKEATSQTRRMGVLTVLFRPTDLSSTDDGACAIINPRALLRTWSLNPDLHLRTVRSARDIVSNVVRFR